LPKGDFRQRMANARNARTAISEIALPEEKGGAQLVIDIMGLQQEIRSSSQHYKHCQVVRN